MSDATEEDRSRRYVARGVAQVDATAPAAPVVLSFVLTPGFTMLAFTSAVEPLRVANQLTGRRLFEWHVWSEGGTPVTGSNGLSVIVDGPIPKDTQPGYVLICGGVEPDTNTSQALADWIRSQWRRGRTVGSLCSGAYTLARAGILGGRRFTLHWENIAGFCQVYPQLEPLRRLYCMDDRIVTCAGGVAGAEMVLKIISDHVGPVVAQAVMDMCLLTQNRRAEDDQVASLASRLGTRNPHILAAAVYIESRLEEEVQVAECAEHIGVTSRQLQRLFREKLGMTPKEYLTTLRLRKGRGLLAETNLSVLEIALSCGFSSAAHFARSFRRKYGVSPTKFSHFGGA
ncbi:GlxA family transcriptional regulator [Frigidibacter sp. MR17.14]|uniref:GlxA family transcriptional regulator n=1 Tax=Frigidibacter sp. MR17.14 TaxID=3126509 RepID=UPI003012C921